MSLAQRILDVQDDGGYLSKIKSYPEDPEIVQDAIKFLWDAEERWEDTAIKARDDARLYERKQCCMTICELCKVDYPVRFDDQGTPWHEVDGPELQPCEAWKIRKHLPNDRTLRA